MYLSSVAQGINIDPAKNIVVFSDPRGGSTWITELISTIPNTAVIWEPLHINAVEIFGKIGFGWQQHIPEDEIWNEAYDALDKVFRGKVLNTWTTYLTSVQKLREANSLIIKFCRANAMIPWIVHNFKFEKKPIYLIRHPFAVVASQLAHGGWSHLPDIMPFNIPDTPFNDIFLEHEKFLRTIRYKDEVFVAIWCITNMVPLRHEKNNIDWITINYEELVLNSRKTLDRILKEWEIDKEYLSYSFSKKSVTTEEGSPINGMDQIRYWEEKLSTDQIKRMERVLNYFDIECYTNDPLPSLIYS